MATIPNPLGEPSFGVLNRTLMTDIQATLTKIQAKRLTDRIRKGAEGLFQLVAEAYNGQAWLALDYGSWEQYIESEFDMTRQNAYRLLTQASVTQALEQAAGVKLPPGTVSARQAEAIKSNLPEVVEKVAKATKGTRRSLRVSKVKAEVEEGARHARVTPSEEVTEGFEERLAQMVQDGRLVGAQVTKDEVEIRFTVSLEYATKARAMADKSGESLFDWWRSLGIAAIDAKPVSARSRAKPSTTDASGCPHPSNRRVGDVCMRCGTNLKTKKEA
jgi:hypothetical protein